MQNHRTMRWPFRKKATSNKEEARRFYNAKDYRKAEPFLDSMLKDNPNDAWAMDVLSRLYMNTEQHHRAIPLLHRFLELKGSDASMLKRLVHVATVAGNFPVVQLNVPQIEWEKDDLYLVEKIVENFENGPDLIELMENIANRSDLLYPALKTIHLRHLLNSSDVNPEEFTSISIAGDLSPTEYILLLELCEIFELPDLRIQHQFNHLNSIDQKTPAKRMLAKELLRKSRNEEAIQVLQSVLVDHPEDVQSLTSLTLLGARTHQPQLVVEATRALIGLDSATLPVSKRFAKAANSMRDASTIVEAITQLAEFDVDRSGTLREAYRVCVEEDDASAISSLEALCQSEAQLYDLRAIKTLHYGGHHEAINLINEGLERFPMEVLLLHRKANILRTIGDAEGCIALCDQILNINPDHLKASILRTQMGTKVWEDGIAIQEYEAMIEQFPTCVKFHHQLLNYAYSAKVDMDWSKRIIERARAQIPNDLRLKFYQALVHAHLGEAELAQQTMADTLKFHPMSDNALIAAAQVHKEIGNPADQLRFINALLEKQHLAPLISLEDNKISPEFLSTEPLAPTQSGGKVSVIMTTYKRDPLLDVAIDSILNQTYQNLELIVVDDCSPDDNFSYLQERAAQDHRLRVFQMAENGGTYLAKNFGIGQAKGEFLAFMDSDDFAHPQKLERQVSVLESESTIQGVVHRCIRIDEESNIEFRGVGPFRMSCISLMIRRNLVDIMGYFDSLRVGADTEFIERIDAVFGKGSLLEADDLTLFMMRHSSSLTGGGPFHISWRSVAGPRFLHHTNFRLWHKQVARGIAPGYVPLHMVNRPFEVDESQKSTHYNWLDGMPLFSEQIQKRHARWWNENQDIWQKSLSAKLSGRRFVKKLGLKVPELYWSGTNLDEIPDFEDLPKNFVLKPEEGWNSNNVYCMKDGMDILTHARLSRDDIISLLNEDEFFTTKQPNIMIEELLEPEPKQSADGIPRDFKFYCFGDKIALLHVALRKSEVHKEQNEHHYLTSNFELFHERVMKHRDQGTELIPRPDCWDEMIEAVQTIGRAVGIYMRIDMYATNRGAVFGEFTPTPHGGKGYNEGADRYLAGFWKGEEGTG